METPKQANYALKTESVKNRTVCNDLNDNHTSTLPKIVKQIMTIKEILISISIKIINLKSLSG